MTKPDRLRRLARAQRALAEVAKAESIAARARFEASRAEADEILGALNEESALHGLAVAAMAQTLRRNGRATERLRRVADEREALHARQDRAAEVLEERAHDEGRRASVALERKRLQNLVSSPPRR